MKMLELVVPTQLMWSTVIYPWLIFGKTSVKKVKVVLDLENNKASVLGNEVELYCTSAGHYCIPISSPEMQVGEIFQVLFTMQDKDKGEKEKVIFKKVTTKVCSSSQQQTEAFVERCWC